MTGVSGVLYWTTWLGVGAIGYSAGGAWAKGRRIDAAARFLTGGVLDVGRGYAFDILTAKAFGGIAVAISVAYLWKHRPPPRRRDAHRHRFETA